MRTAIVFTMTAFFPACPLLSASADDAATAASPLAGTWVVIESRSDGGVEKKIVGLKMTFAGHKIKLELGEEKREGTYSVDLSRSPNWIDVTTVTADGSTEAFQGVFSLKDERLIICHAKPGTDRPDKVVTKPGDKRSLVVLKRLEPRSESNDSR